MLNLKQLKACLRRTRWAGRVSLRDQRCHEAMVRASAFLTGVTYASPRLSEARTATATEMHLSFKFTQLLIVRLLGSPASKSTWQSMSEPCRRSGLLRRSSPSLTGSEAASVRRRARYDPL